MRNTGKHTKYKKRAASRNLIAALCAALVFTLCTGTVTARYVTTMETEFGLFRAEEFYFESDFLSKRGENYTILCSDLTQASVNFNLYNHKDSLNFSESEIQYSIQYELNGIHQTATGSIAGGDDNGALVQYGLKQNFGINAFATQAEVKVTATSTSPYRKVLKATFNFVESDNAPDYFVYDSAGSNAGTITVTTGGIGGALSITLPAGCFFDPTSSYPGSVETNTLSFPASSDAEYSFTYLKTSPDINYADKVIVQLNSTVVSAALEQ